MSPSLRGETLNGREAGASDLFGLRPGARILDPFEEPIDLSDTILYRACRSGAILLLAGVREQIEH
jgi:hypothetical protein